MRASRLVELLLLLQVRGPASARELADALEGSTRTVYRDREALAASGVPVYAEPGRNGGIRLVAGYRVGGLPRLETAEARAMMLGAVPTVARELEVDPGAGQEKLLAAMDTAASAAARSV